jgi:transposase
MVLLSNQGRHPAEIAAITQQSDDTVRRWLQRFEDEGCTGLIERPRSGRPAQVTDAVDQFLWKCMHKSPRKFGVDRPFWTTSDLAGVLKRKLGVTVTDECVRQHLLTLNFVCRRPTWTVKPVAQQQPGYAQKKGR